MLKNWLIYYEVSRLNSPKKLPEVGSGWVVSTLKGNLVYSEGILHVVIVAIVCFDNPLEEHGAVLIKRRQFALLISSIVGAYNIVTRYLKAPKVSTKSFMTRLL